MYFNDVFVTFAIKDIICQHNNDSKYIIVKFELFKYELNTILMFQIFKFVIHADNTQHQSNYMRYTRMLIIIIYRKNTLSMKRIWTMSKCDHY